MDEDTRWTVIIVATILGIILVIIIPTWLDKRQERFMAEKGYCYQAVDRQNTSGTFQYQKCQ